MREIGSSWLRRRELGNSKLRQRELSDFRFWSMTQLQLVRRSSRIQRFGSTGSSWLNPSQHFGPGQVRSAAPGPGSSKLG